MRAVAESCFADSMLERNASAFSCSLLEPSCVSAVCAWRMTCSPGFMPLPYPAANTSKGSFSDSSGPLANSRASVVLMGSKPSRMHNIRLMSDSSSWLAELPGLAASCCCASHVRKSIPRPAVFCSRHSLRFSFPASRSCCSITSNPLSKLEAPRSPSSTALRRVTSGARRQNRAPWECPPPLRHGAGKGATAKRADPARHTSGVKAAAALPAVRVKTGTIETCGFGASRVCHDAPEQF
mmetsp:Transcript_6939/g.17930  ORF Transcript_6939/g.17930 Transcript_6939/m.17930 type:complete len:239 (+) Transcript_6939:1392-2108(+)